MATANKKKSILLDFSFKIVILEKNVTHFKKVSKALAPDAHASYGDKINNFGNTFSLSLSIYLPLSLPLSLYLSLSLSLPLLCWIQDGLRRFIISPFYLHFLYRTSFSSATSANDGKKSGTQKIKFKFVVWTPTKKIIFFDAVKMHQDLSCIVVILVHMF